LRPERIVVAPGVSDSGVVGRVALVTYLGAATEYRVTLDGGETITASVPTPRPGDPLKQIAAGDAVTLTWPAETCRLLAPGPGATPDEGGL
jgi:ABC-type Fe3+/spermidine/putrescine transport system ATPase subunit